MVAQLWLTIIHALKYEPSQTCLTCSSILRACFIVVFQVVKRGLFPLFCLLDKRLVGGVRSHRCSGVDTPYLISQTRAGSSMASSSGGIWRRCSDVWVKLVSGNVTPTMCVHVCVLHCCQNIELFPKWEQRSLCWDDSERQSSESLRLHKLLSQA